METKKSKKVYLVKDNDGDFESNEFKCYKEALDQASGLLDVSDEDSETEIWEAKLVAKIKVKAEIKEEKYE